MCVAGWGCGLNLLLPLTEPRSGFPTRLDTRRRRASRQYAAAVSTQCRSFGGVWSVRAHLVFYALLLYRTAISRNKECMHVRGVKNADCRADAIVGVAWPPPCVAYVTGKRIDVNVGGARARRRHRSTPVGLLHPDQVSDERRRRRVRSWRLRQQLTSLRWRKMATFIAAGA